MPTEFTIDPEHRVVVSRGSGVLTHADCLDHLLRMQADPRFNPDFNEIVDCRRFSHMDLSGQQISDLAGRSAFGRETRRAFVVASELQFGLARMFATYRQINGGQEVMVFRDMPSAISWLDLPAHFDAYAMSETSADADD
jgi:hypothetical protein